MIGMVLERVRSNEKERVWHRSTTVIRMALERVRSNEKERFSTGGRGSGTILTLKVKENVIDYNLTKRKGKRHN